MCINSANSLCGWVLSDSSQFLRRTPFQLPCEASHTQRASSSASARKTGDATQISCSHPAAAGHGHSWRESINEGEQILLQVSRDGPEHPSLKQWPKSPKNPPTEARGQGEGCLALLICAVFLRWLQNPSGIYFICFSAGRLVRMHCPKTHTLTIYLLLIRNLLSWRNRGERDCNMSMVVLSAASGEGENIFCSFDQRFICLPC